MIIEWLFSLWADISIGFMGMLPPIEGVDETKVGIGNILGPVAAGLTGLGGWIPWDVVNLLLPISVGLYLAGFVLRGVKAFIPTISG